MVYLSASKNKKHQENIRFYKPKFLGVSYILKGVQLECGKTAFCYSPLRIQLRIFVLLVKYFYTVITVFHCLLQAINNHFIHVETQFIIIDSFYVFLKNL